MRRLTTQDGINIALTVECLLLLWILDGHSKRLVDLGNYSISLAAANLKKGMDIEALSARLVRAESALAEVLRSEP